MERKTKLIILVLIKGEDAKTVRQSFAEVFNEIESEMRLSMTYDRGLEMAEEKALRE